MTDGDTDQSTDGTKRSRRTERVSNSPDKGPIELLRLAWSRYIGMESDGEQSDE